MGSRTGARDTVATVFTWGTPLSYSPVLQPSLQDCMNRASAYMYETRPCRAGLTGAQLTITAHSPPDSCPLTPCSSTFFAFLEVTTTSCSAPIRATSKPGAGAYDMDAGWIWLMRQRHLPRDHRASVRVGGHRHHAVFCHPVMSAQVASARWSFSRCALTGEVCTCTSRAGCWAR
jgi:hypothetical protein